MKTKHFCIGAALFAGVLGHSATARADEPCSDVAFLAGLCEVLGSILDTDPAEPTHDAGAVVDPAGPQPSDSSEAPITPAPSGTSSTSNALTSGGTSHSYTSKDSELSGPPVLDPVAAPNGESPATADLGEVGGGGGCTVSNGRHETSSTCAAGLAAMSLVVARIARRRRTGDEH